MRKGRETRKRDEGVKGGKGGRKGGREEEGEWGGGRKLEPPLHFRLKEEGVLIHWHMCIFFIGTFTCRYLHDYLQYTYIKKYCALTFHDLLNLFYSLR